MNSNRHIVEGAQWVVSVVRGVGSTESVYSAECITCAAPFSVVADDPHPAGVWSLEHVRQNGPAHTEFLVTKQECWRVDPLPEGRAAAVERRPRRRAAARRQTLVQRAAAYVSRFAGPLLLAALLTGAILIGLLLGVDHAAGGD